MFETSHFFPSTLLSKGMCLTYMAAASGSNAIVSISVSIPAWVTNDRHSEYTSIEQCNLKYELTEKMYIQITIKISIIILTLPDAKIFLKDK